MRCAVLIAAVIGTLVTAPAVNAQVPLGSVEGEGSLGAPSGRALRERRLPGARLHVCPNAFEDVLARFDGLTCACDS